MCGGKIIRPLHEASVKGEIKGKGSGWRASGENEERQMSEKSEFEMPPLVSARCMRTGRGEGLMRMKEERKTTMGKGVEKKLRFESRECFSAQPSKQATFDEKWLEMEARASPIEWERNSKSHVQVILRGQKQRGAPQTDKLAAAGRLTMSQVLQQEGDFLRPLGQADQDSTQSHTGRC